VKYRANQYKANKKLKVVCLLSTDHCNEVVPSSKTDRDGNPVLKPTCVLDYNRCMGGVDLMDQQLQSLLVIRKAYTWYKKVFFRLLMQCLLSSHKMYKLEMLQYIKLQHFKTYIEETTIGPFGRLNVI